MMFSVVAFLLSYLLSFCCCLLLSSYPQKLLFKVQIHVLLKKKRCAQCSRKLKCRHTATTLKTFLRQRHHKRLDLIGCFLYVQRRRLCIFDALKRVDHKFVQRVTVYGVHERTCPVKPNGKYNDDECDQDYHEENDAHKCCLQPFVVDVVVVCFVVVGFSR